MPPEAATHTAPAHTTTLRTTALIRHNTRLLLAEPGPLLSRLIVPVGFLALMRPLLVATQGQKTGTEQAVIGSLVTFSLLGLSIVGSAVLSERVQRTWDRMRATAARPAELLAGKAVPVMAALLAQQAVVLGVGIAAFGVDVLAPALLILVCLSWTTALLALGAALGVTARSFGELSLGYDVGGMILGTVGGALVPLATLPAWVQVIAPASPGYWAVSAFRAALHGDTSTALPACGALLLFAAAAAALAAWRLSRGAARSDRM
ncbi:ABC transporter permease [Streptomyces sp. A7024]|uniref:Transport permease protein n=1 Tax=Streptomyces coryli TaxID=1128680 RepID=A0A6G4UF81_9ACTN|nr:ABC transporter permease [Streptomyces coryli]NGN70460.1 ABC transporter permease [Streptomyces coryli]